LLYTPSLVFPNIHCHIYSPLCSRPSPFAIDSTYLYISLTPPLAFSSFANP